MPKIKVRDIEMYYEIRGEGHPLLLIMGFLGNADCWDPLYLIPNLVDRFKLILFENRGSGRTDFGNPGEDFTIRLMADDTAALLDALGIEHAYVLGYSRGGMIAQELAINYPEKVDKLILTSAYCGGKESALFPNQATEAIINIASALDEKGGWDHEIANMYMPNIFTDEYMVENPGGADVAIELILTAPTSLETLSKQFFAMSDFDVCNHLPEIVAPTLIIAGEKDRYVPPENAAILTKRIPGSKVMYLEKSGHQLEEESEQATEAIIEFLSTR